MMACPSRSSSMFRCHTQISNRRLTFGLTFAACFVGSVNKSHPVHEHLRRKVTSDCTDNLGVRASQRIKVTRKGTSLPRRQPSRRIFKPFSTSYGIAIQVQPRCQAISQHRSTRQYASGKIMRPVSGSARVCIARDQVAVSASRRHNIAARPFIDRLVSA